MKWILIGHRGVGKSSLLNRIRQYFPDEENLEFFDLDQEIASRQGRDIKKIFQELGETQFRILENQVFKEIIQNVKKYIVSVGAGYDFSFFPPDAKCLWVKRRTDSFGRVFLNRPRLNPSVGLLDEYFERFAIRNERYQQKCDYEYLMPEGLDGFSENLFEKQVLQWFFEKKSPSELRGIITILPDHVSDVKLNSIMQLSFDLFELRDDLLDVDTILKIASQLPSHRILLSFRNQITDARLVALSRQLKLWDWDSELKPCSFGTPPIVSFHDIPKEALKSKKDLEVWIQQKVKNSESHLKLAPIIESFQQLKVLYDWQKESPEKRSVLPRSPAYQNEKWTWFRLKMKFNQKINFIRIDQGSALDQPSLYQWISLTNPFEKFAAVLGNPVLHSRSPVFHQKFFTEYKIPFFAISIDPNEFQESFQFLDEVGLSFAAVTSPLKELALQVCKQKSPISEQLKSVNTLVKKDFWIGENTDLVGFKTWIDSIDVQSRSVAIWGGGGTLRMIQQVLPEAVCYSSRTGQLKMNGLQVDSMIEHQLEGPEVVVWAAGPDAQSPVQNWHPTKILDLNYREDSNAKEYASEANAEYQDGLRMFETQGKAQQDFWKKYLE